VVATLVDDAGFERLCKHASRAGHRRLAFKAADAREKRPVLLFGPFTSRPRVARVLQTMVKGRWAALLHIDDQRRSLTRIACCSAA